MISNPLKLLVLPSIVNIEEIIKDMPVILTKAYYSSIEFIIKDNNISILHKGTCITKFDFVWLSSYWATRDLAYAVKSYLLSKNITSSYVEASPSKLTDNIIFALNDIPVPNTYYLENAELKNNIESIESVCGYPMIMKDLKGCAGENAQYIETRTKLKSCIETRLKERKFMFQTYIPNDYDWGVLVSQNEVVSGEMSYPKEGEFRNNVGATENFTSIEDIPINIKDIAVKAGSALDLTWSRSDIIIDKNTGKPYILEVNRFPGITSESSEVDGAKIFLKDFLNITSSNIS